MAEDLTPDAVVERNARFREEHLPDDVPAPFFEALLTPRARARILSVLVGAAGESLTVADICDRGDIAQSSFARQRDALLDLDVMERGEKVANASTYRLNRDHPAAQLLGMLDQVMRFGTTAMLLDEQFVGTPGEGYEPGDHPADPR